MFQHKKLPSLLPGERQAWRMLGALGIGLPALRFAHAPLAAVGLTGLTLGAPLVWSVVQAQRVRNGVRPSVQAFRKRVHERRKFSTFPIAMAFENARDEASFAAMITEAAHCSNEYGRRLAVICVHAPALPWLKHHLVAELMRAHLRSTDEVQSVRDGEFLIVTPLLRDAHSTNVIVRRLERVVANAALGSARAGIRIGAGIYPLDGYTGDALIKAARERRRPLSGSLT